jgi:hypothetical protein
LVSGLRLIGFRQFRMVQRQELPDYVGGSNHRKGLGHRVSPEFHHHNAETQRPILASIIGAAPFGVNRLVRG